MDVLRYIPDGCVCGRCGGQGSYVYGSTSVYWGGIGGAAMTEGACNKCWGSGRSDVIWPDHRIAARVKSEIARRAKISKSGGGP